MLIPLTNSDSDRFVNASRNAAFALSEKYQPYDSAPFNCYDFLTAETATKYKLRRYLYVAYPDKHAQCFLLNRVTCVAFSSHYLYRIKWKGLFMPMPKTSAAHLYRRCIDVADAHNMFVVEKRDDKTDKPVFLLYRLSEISSKKNFLVAKRSSVYSLYKTIIKLTGWR